MSLDPNWRDRIVVTPSVLSGKPSVRGLPVSVEDVVRAKADGASDDRLLADFPGLDAADIAACLAYAAGLAGAENV